MPCGWCEAFEVLIGIEILAGKCRGIQRADHVIDQVIWDAMGNTQAPMLRVLSLCMALNLVLPLLLRTSVLSTRISLVSTSQTSTVDAARIEARFTRMTKLLSHLAAST
jgi:hypothetical protein